MGLKNPGKWIVTTLLHMIHSVPLNDLEEHELTTTCRCQPRIEIYTHILVLHNSYDKREEIERLSEGIYLKDKEWAVIENL